VILSNCVVNLSPDKPQVLREAFRVLRPGGRLALSDTVALAPLPAALRDDPALYCGCISGAATVAELEEWLAAAGFADIRIAPKATSAEFIAHWAPGHAVEDYVASATIEARKPVEEGARQ
jgi:SAM-dependent methyltransferase